jgi:alpha-tubulin suppressor-like RCC1 family protein
MGADFSLLFDTSRPSCQSPPTKGQDHRKSLMKKPAFILSIPFLLLIGWTLYNTFYGMPRFLPQVSKALIPPPVVVTLTTSNAPLRVFPGLGGATFLLPDGTLWRWGMSPSLGNGRLLVPTKMESESTWGQMVTAGTRNVALKDDGSIWEWGWTNGTRGTVSAPQQVDSGHDWISITAQSQYSVALKRDGTLWKWGNGFNGASLPGNNPYPTNLVQIGTNQDWITIGAGQNDSVYALRKDHTLWAWGQVFDRTTRRPTPLLTPVRFSSNSNWVSFGSGFVCYLRNSKGEIYSPLFVSPAPDISMSKSNSPLATEVFTDELAFALTDHHNLFTIRPDGTLWRMPVKYGLNGVKSSQKWHRQGSRSDWISLFPCGGATALALTADGTIWMWGQDTGQEPIITTKSRLKQFKNRLFTFTGLPTSSASNESTYPFQREPRPLLRLVYSNTNQVTAGK